MPFPNKQQQIAKQNQHVLVIGGGYGGCAAIKGLRKFNKQCRITLIEPKDYVETFWAAYRAPFDAKTHSKALAPLAPFCQSNNVKHIRSTVTTLSPTKAVLANGEKIENFDACVVATGASTPWPALGRGPLEFSIQDRRQQAAAEGQAILNAKHVLIVGGGLIGAELAGDVAYFLNVVHDKDDAKITLVHSGPRLCPEMTTKAAAMVQDQLEAAGVTVLLNEYAQDVGHGEFQLSSSNQVIYADKVLRTTGLVSVNEFVRGIKEGCLNEQAFLVTDECFRVARNIFAIGDCCTLLPNSGLQILENIRIIGYNVNAVLKNGGDTSKLKRHRQGIEVFNTTTGFKSGVMYSPTFMGGMTTQRFFPWVKNKTMFLFRPKWTLGLKSLSGTAT